MANNLKAIEEKLGRKLKKPVCAYSLFVKENRNLTQKNNPGKSHVDIMQILSRQWKSLENDVRQVYEKKAEEDKHRYNQDQIMFNQEFLRSKQESESNAKMQQASRDNN